MMGFMYKKKILCFFLFFIGILSHVQSQNIDINLLSNINLNRNKKLDNAFNVLSVSSVPLSISTPLIVYGVSLLTKDTQTQWNAIYIGTTLITASLVSTALKYSVNRARPFETYLYIEQAAKTNSPSFPSGHTSNAFALATSLSLAYPKWYVIVPSYLWATTIGFSRMDLGVHYPSDVLIGAILGTASAYVCYKGQQWLNQKTKCKQYITFP